MIKFRATKQQVQQIAVNAVKASRPIGMGHLHFDSKTNFKPEQFEVTDSLHLDYVQGRMVKLNIWKKAENEWETRDKTDLEYQSWARKYPTYEALLESVSGVEIVTES